MSNYPGREIIETVHRAWLELERGNTEQALRTLQAVELQAVAFASFHVVKASALLQRGELRPSLVAAQQALELAPNSPHAQLIESIAKHGLSSDSSTPTLASYLDPLEIRAIEVEDSSDYFDLDKTADELSRERPLVRPVTESEVKLASQFPDPEKQPSLVSETLAEIMIRQGKLAEAKKVYIQLSRLQPSRYDYFQTKIEAIDKLVLGTGIADHDPHNDTDEKGQNE